MPTGIKPRDTRKSTVEKVEARMQELAKNRPMSVIADLINAQWEVDNIYGPGTAEEMLSTLGSNANKSDAVGLLWYLFERRLSK